MWMLTLAISCLTTSNLPWFTDLTFQVPIWYCSLQHRTLLLLPVIPTTGCCFPFRSASSLFLELISPLFSSSILGTYRPEEFIFHVISFCLFILFMSSLSTEVVCHSLLQRTTFCQNSPPWPMLITWFKYYFLSFSFNYWGTNCLYFLPAGEVVCFAIQCYHWVFLNKKQKNKKKTEKLKFSILRLCYWVLANLKLSYLLTLWNITIYNILLH